VDARWLNVGRHQCGALFRHRPKAPRIPDPTVTHECIYLLCNLTLAEDGSVPVTTTADTLADFVAKWGKPNESDDTYAHWYSVQTRPGARRGKLYVVDCGDFRAARFDGEA